MKYTFFPSLLVRTPAFSFQDYAAADYPMLLKNEFFKLALCLASKDFYSELEKREFDYHQLTEAQQRTLQKYYNRACYRPTPFGAFSVVASAGWSEEADQLLHEEEAVNVHFKLDYLPELDLCEKLMAEEGAAVMRYKANTSLYKVSRHLRYIRYDTEKQSFKRSFSIVSLVDNKVVGDTIRYCATSRTTADIEAFIQEKTNYDPAVTRYFLSQLISEQILLPQWGINITGDGSLPALLQFLEREQVRSAQLDSAATLLRDLQQRGMKSMPLLESYRQQLAALLPETGSYRQQFYVVSERDRVKGGISAGHQQTIREALYCLDKLTAYNRSEDLENFKRRFTAKFENREIPLLSALDPEIGIGYENLEDVIFREDSLVKDIPFEEVKQENKFIKWTAVHALLLNKIQQGSHTDANRIVLSGEDLAGISPENDDYRMPPSISVVFRIHNGAVYIESAGGISGTSLIGRFSAFNDQILEMAEAIANKEQEVNEQVLFAEIAHVCDMHAANINRRRHIRKYEIPMLVMSTLPEENQIALSDLFISVSGNRVVMRSRKHNAIVVPRLSSAFNYVNSDLSIFRFLCDLQYQGFKTSFQLSLENFFPGLKFYPRVEYQAAILSLATWRLTATDFAFIKTVKPEQYSEKFKALAAELKLPRFFALTYHDNQLVFDRESNADVLLFLDAVKNTANITLTEYLMNEQQTSPLQNGAGKPFVAQYITSLYLEEPVFDGGTGQAFEAKSGTTRNFAPGTEWLYFKIYCHPVWTNELLCSILLPLLNRVYKKKMIDKWFFIRYNDPDNHIRLRLHVVNGGSDALITAFSKKLKTLLDEHKIEKYYIDTYVRELERYSPVDIEDIEEFFFSSSVYALQYFTLLQQEGGAFSNNLDYILLSIDTICDAFGLTVQQKTALFEGLYYSFYKEFGEHKNLKKGLEKKYYDLRREMNEIAANMKAVDEKLSVYRQRLYEDSLRIATKAREKQPDGIPKVIADIVHMHLNRLFVQNQRRHELITYYLLYKHYNTMMYKSQPGSDKIKLPKD